MKVGDKVKVIYKSSSKFESVGELSEITYNVVYDIYRISFPNDENMYSFFDNQLAVIVGEKPAEIPAGRIPIHYSTESENSIDVIDICKIYNLNFNRGNVVKYTCRAGKKDDEIKDLQKAVDYLQREIKFLINNKKVMAHIK